MKTEMQVLNEMRNEYEREIAVLRSKIDVIDEAIKRAITVKAEKPLTNKNHRKGGVRDFLIDTLRSQPNGLNVDGILAIAAEKKRKIKRTTASSMLSRLKSEDELTFDGHVYRVPEFSLVNGVHH